ncbi:MAG: hypothetical protein PHV59_09400, partial [Victivallales bacterium]|nr:hypothetical protein [Victivallales bacterium]
MIWKKFLLPALFSASCFLPEPGNALSPLSVMSDKVPKNFNPAPEVFGRRFFLNAVPGADEKKLGLIAGVIDNAQEINVVMPDERPVPDKVIKRFIPKGEYSIATFVLECLKEQPEIKVSVSELKDRSGKVVNAGNLKIFRVVNHRRNPQYYGNMLINPELKNIPSGAVLQYCLFITVPEKTAAGIYNGSVRISTAAGSLAMPVRLRVMDFTLPDTGAVFGTFLPGHFYAPRRRVSYYGGNACWCPEFYTGGGMDLFFRFWKTRKLNSPALGHCYPVWENRDGKEVPDFSTLRVFAESMKRNGLKGPLCSDAIFFETWALAKERSTGVKAERWFGEAIRELVSVAAKEKWPEMLFFPEEEIGNPNQGKKDRYARFWKVLREASGGRDYVIDNDIGYGRRDAVDRGNTDDFRIIQYNSWEEGALQKAREAGRTVWIYNYGGLERANYGFLMQKLGATGNHQWADMWYVNLPNLKQGYVYSIICPDGIISSTQYERVHEGINDYAHCYLLKELNKRLIEKGFKEAALNNEKILAGILKDVPVGGPEFRAWMKTITDTELDIRRWAVAMAIENSSGILAGKSSRPEPAAEKVQISVQTAPVLKSSISETSAIIMAPLLPRPGKPKINEIRSYPGNSTGMLRMRVCDEIRLKAQSASEEDY